MATACNPSTWKRRQGPVSEPASHIACMYVCMSLGFDWVIPCQQRRWKVIEEDSSCHAQASTLIHTCIHIPYTDIHLHTYKHIYIQASHAHSSKKGKKKDKNSKIKQKPKNPKRHYWSHTADFTYLVELCYQQTATRAEIHSIRTRMKYLKCPAFNNRDEPRNGNMCVGRWYCSKHAVKTPMHIE